MKYSGLVLRIMMPIVLAALVFAQKVEGQEQPDDAAWQRYIHILRASTLEWLSSQPFLLKVDFQLYDLDGNPVEKGTAEESWSETDGKRIHIQSPSLVEGDTPAADEFTMHTRESYLIHQGINALVRPFPSVVARKDFAIDEFRQALGDAQVSCFSLVSAGKTRTSMTPAYCTDADNRIVSMAGQLFVLERSDFRKYRDHEVPIYLKLSYEGRPALTMHVTELDRFPDIPASKIKTKPSSSASSIPSETLAGHLLKKKDPSYPKEAKKKHITGSVLLTAIITKQGTIGWLDVIASPSPLLTESAKDAVKTWTYQPYILNGSPTEVETAITVNFDMGSK